MASRPFNILATVVLVSSVLVFWPGLTEAQEACLDKLTSCSSMVTTKTQSIASLLQSPPVNLTALTSQCQALQGSLDTCKSDLREVCSSVDDALQGLQNSYDSLCGTDMMCTLRMQQCSQDLSNTEDITSAMTQTPPNVQVIKDKCSKLTGTVRPCLERLQSDCSNVSSVSTSLPSLINSFDSFCSESVLCQMQIGRCQWSFTQLSSSNGSQNERIAQLCRAQKSAKMCMATEVDAGCYQLQDVVPVIQNLNNTHFAVVCGDGESGTGGSGSGDNEGCPQVFQCISQMRTLTLNNCSSMGQVMGCLSGLKGTCQVKESPATFKQLESLAVDMCTDLESDKSGAAENCTQLGNCIIKSDVVQKMSNFGQQRPTAEDLKRMFQLVLDSNTWCQYLETVSGCIVSDDDTCHFDANMVQSMKQHNTKLKEICSAPSDGVRGSVLNYLLIGSLAAFTVWRQSSHI